MLNEADRSSFISSSYIPPVLWSGLCCYTEGWGGKCSEILATIKLLYNPRVNKVFTSIHIQLASIYLQL